MECFKCNCEVDEKILVCPECGVGYKEEIERGIEVIGVDYSHEGTIKALDDMEEI